MNEPKRIQRKRAKGCRMPEGAVYVGRPTRWGNPFRVDGSWVEGMGMLSCSTDRAGQHGVATQAFRTNLLRGRLGFTVDDVRRELRGKDLACWCPPDRPCHADVLLDEANRQEEAQRNE